MFPTRAPAAVLDASTLSPASTLDAVLPSRPETKDPEAVERWSLVA